MLDPINLGCTPLLFFPPVDDDLFCPITQQKPNLPRFVHGF